MAKDDEDFELDGAGDGDEEPVEDLRPGSPRQSADHRRRIERYWELKRLRQQVEDLGTDDFDPDSLEV